MIQWLMGGLNRSFAWELFRIETGRQFEELVPEV